MVESSRAVLIWWSNKSCLTDIHRTFIGSREVVKHLLLFHHYSHHDDVIKWKHFPRYWSFVRGIHRSPVNSPHKGQWRGALMFSMICARINGWLNNGKAVDLRRHRVHYDVIVMNLVWSWFYCYIFAIHAAQLRNNIQSSDYAFAPSRWLQS